MVRLNQHIQDQVRSGAVEQSGRISGAPGSALKPVESTSHVQAPVDGTKFSSTAAIVAHATAGSDVRTDKVLALQAAIQSGTYKVSSSDLADKVIDSLLGGK